MIGKQASLFEIGIGKGGMLVCTLNVSNSDSVSNSLYNHMLRYLVSDEFKSKIEVTADWIRNLLVQNKDLVVDFSTDEVYGTGGHIEVL